MKHQLFGTFDALGAPRNGEPTLPSEVERVRTIRAVRGSVGEGALANVSGLALVGGLVVSYLTLFLEMGGDGRFGALMCEEYGRRVDRSIVLWPFKSGRLLHAPALDKHVQAWLPTLSEKDPTCLNGFLER